MRYVIVLAPEAVEDLNDLEANVRAAVHDALERHLRHQPTKVSKSRIKRLRGLSHPQYRLRVADDIRVFYDVTAEVVQVLAIVPKSEAEAWLARHGEYEGNDETSSSVRHQR
jgi:mRNA interferase RelE/StbE